MVFDGSSAEAWEKVIVKLRSRAMPPPGIRRPDNAAYDAVAGWLETELDRAAASHPNPGRPAGLHRLNRTEYANAVRDLLGVDVDAETILPPDEQAFGFDTNAEALSKVLYADYLLLFQLSGIVRLVAMMGAIVLTLRARPRVKRQNIAQQTGRKRKDAVEMKDIHPGQGI